ncbi:hypothetical protein [Gimesia chilikensis]|uniref:hypothetical protein n=1 Tax=Gimesia chilikensis TaxID=2605989 RepID=UPI0011A6A11A|nr:hypothetical protein [Gimesia chilikensis]
MQAKKILQSAFVEELKYTFSGEYLLERLKVVSISINGKVLDGIDLLLSTVVPGNEYLELRRCRIYRLLEMINETHADSEPAGLVRLIETFASHLDHMNLCSPLWFEVAESIYRDKMYPHVIRKLNKQGQKLVRGLLAQAGKFITSEKYRFSSVSPPQVLAKTLIEKCEEISDHYDRRDTLEDDSFSLWGW